MQLIKVKYSGKSDVIVTEYNGVKYSFAKSAPISVIPLEVYNYMLGDKSNIFREDIVPWYDESKPVEKPVEKPAEEPVKEDLKEVNDIEEFSDVEKEIAENVLEGSKKEIEEIQQTKEISEEKDLKKTTKKPIKRGKRK